MANKPDPSEEQSSYRVVDRRGRNEEPHPEAAPKATEPAPKAAPKPAEAAPPPVDFTTFILSLATTALVQMGAAPHPETEQTEANPVLARETINLLGMLREKTRGNLTEDESKFLDALLYDLRVRFVELTRKKP